MADLKTSAYSEVYDFLVSTPTPEDIIAFHPSEVTQERVRSLADASQRGRLSEDEAMELAEFEKVEHFMRMLKIHARQKMMNPL
jgi:hypothetical protein